MLNYIKAKLFGGLQSEVPGHRGECYPVWINNNQALRRLDGHGISGFFKSLAGGPFSPEFHGIVWTDGLVYSTEGVYKEFRGPDHTISRLWCHTCTGVDRECPECHGEGETRMTVKERAQWQQSA